MQIASVQSVPADELAWITKADMVEVDRVMIEDLHIELTQMMENAGRSLARLVLEAAAPARVGVAAGTGGNGGGGLVAARHLHNAGIEVIVVSARPQVEMTAVSAHQLDILERMGLARAAEMPDVDVVIDAVIGYSLRGAPRGSSEAVIRAIRGAKAVVSLDTPSGLDVTSGSAPGAVVTADATMTLALPKVGLRNSPYVGQLYLADISVPPEVADTFGADAPSFGSHGLLRVV